MTASAQAVSVRSWVTYLFLALIVFVGCGDHSQPNFLLITLDTTRIDRIGCYGSKSVKTPNIDRIADEGIRFETALCQAPITRPSHASMLTSQYPRTHGVMRNQDQVPPHGPMLPEFLQCHGYETAAFTSVRLLIPKAGFGRGFDYFNEPPANSGRTRHGKKTIQEAIGWMEKRDSQKPFFIWVHLFDAHLPYHNDEGGEPIHLPPYDGMIKKGTWNQIKGAAEESGISPADYERVLALYNSRVVYVDHCVGRLADWLRDEEVWDQTEVFVLCDHGEGFDHGIFIEHVNSLYRSVAQIAFLWKRAGGTTENRVLPGPVETLDILPTVAEIIGFPAPDGVEGRSLIPALMTEPEIPPLAITEEPLPDMRGAALIRNKNRVLFPKGHPITPCPPREKGERIAITNGEWKYIFDTENEDELYHLTTDPGEEINRIQDAPREIVESLASCLLRWRENHPPKKSTPVESIDPETRTLLEALGYL